LGEADQRCAGDEPIPRNQSKLEQREMRTIELACAAGLGLLSLVSEMAENAKN
jgi:hypothetical protein